MLFQCAIIFSIVSAAAGTCASVVTYPEKDCVGNDLDGKYAMDAATSDACRLICNADPSCMSYEYNAVTHKCYPKFAACAGAQITASTYPVGQLTYYVCKPGTCPAVTTYTDKICIGHDLGTSSGTYAANESVCQSICASNPACVSFVFAFTTKTCYPKDYKCTGTEIKASSSGNLEGSVNYYVC